MEIVKILAIETSCDETAAAIVENGRLVLSSIISSQAGLHAKTGGVVPEVAARQHVPAVIPVINEALKAAGLKISDVDAIAVSECPGLLGALLVGCVTAQFLAYVKSKILIPVNHVAGHLYSIYLNSEVEFEFPRLLLTVSGGHNEIILMRDHLNFEVLGSTLDDSAGEAFDKGARLLGLGYPGGPEIQKAAEKGLAGRYSLPRPMLKDKSLNMSFSGLKTALFYELKKINNETCNKKSIQSNIVNDLAYEYQEAIVEVLIAKLGKTVKLHPEIKEIHLVGGVSANKRLRESISTLGNSLNLPIYFPKDLQFCTDNAAMIGAVAYFQWQKLPQKYSPHSKLNISPTADIMNYYLSS